MCCSHIAVFRYDPPPIASLILAGSVRVSTLEACRNAENDAARDVGEGTKITTSMPGRNSLSGNDLAALLGVDPRGIEVRGKDAVVTCGENAVHRQETLENAFVFCTSAIENDDFMRARFGDGCLKIMNAVAFFELVDAHLRRALAPKTLGECVVDVVEYGPRQNNYQDHTTKHCAFLKPSGGATCFEKESEVRAIWIPKGFKAEPTVLSIPEVSRLLEPMPRRTIAAPNLAGKQN
jgi:hypothetical protein